MTATTSAYYCHSCAAAAGMLPPLPPNFVPSSYQLDKEKKHNTVSSVQGWLGVFNLTASETYWDYIVNPLASGCVEVDAWERRNIILVGSRTPHVTYFNGAYVGPADAVKLVCAQDSSTAHPFAIATSALTVGSCTVCGVRVPY
jgi:hypothetical protein